MRKQQEELLPRFTKVWTFRSNDLVYDKTTCEFNILKYESNQNDCHSWCVQFVACWYTCFCKIVVNRSFVVFQYGHSKLRFWAGLWSRYSNFRLRLHNLKISGSGSSHLNCLGSDSTALLLNTWFSCWWEHRCTRIKSWCWRSSACQAYVFYYSTWNGKRFARSKFLDFENIWYKLFYTWVIVWWRISWIRFLLKVEPNLHKKHLFLFGSIVVGGNFTQKIYGLPNESLSQQNPTNVARGKKFV